MPISITARNAKPTSEGVAKVLNLRSKNLIVAKVAIHYSQRSKKGVELTPEMDLVNLKSVLPNRMAKSGFYLYKRNQERK